jgi:hypothetical protein
MSHCFASLCRATARSAVAAAILFAVGCGHVRAQSAPPPGATTGEIKTAVILVNFQDNTTQPKTAAQSNTLVFGNVSDFLWENSYHHTFLGGDTFGWFTLPMSGAVCDTDTLVREANDAAVAAGANLGAYAQVIYMFPKTRCTWAGLGGIGANGQKLVYVNGTNAFDQRVIAHEMGHGFQLDHSDALECGAASIGSSCSDLDQASPDDTMGSRAGHFNVFQKERLGWLGTSGMPAITTVTASGRYTLEPLETQTTGVKALKIRQGTDPATGQAVWYYLEYRQAVGFDSILASVGTLTSGVSIIRGMPSNTGSVNTLIDTTPESNTLSRLSDFEDGTLQPGRTFTDAAAGVAVSVVSVDANGAVVDITVPGGSGSGGTCTRATPAVSVSGPTGAVAAGSSISYTVAVTNKDSSACAATSFALARTVPAGWSGALGTATLSLSPGASGTTTLTVVSASGAAAGGYAIAAATSSSAGSVHTANATTTYTVASAASTLSDSVGTDKASYVRGDTAAISALVKQDGVALGGAAVTFTVTAPGGSTTTLKATTGSDGYARMSYRTGKSKSALGTYAVRADASAAGGSASANASFGVR